MALFSAILAFLSSNDIEHYINLIACKDTLLFWIKQVLLDFSISYKKELCRIRHLCPSASRGSSGNWGRYMVKWSDCKKGRNHWWKMASIIQHDGWAIWWQGLVPTGMTCIVEVLGKTSRTLLHFKNHPPRGWFYFFIEFMVLHFCTFALLTLRFSVSHE